MSCHCSTSINLGFSSSLLSLVCSTFINTSGAANRSISLRAQQERTCVRCHRNSAVETASGRTVQVILFTNPQVNNGDQPSFLHLRSHVRSAGNGHLLWTDCLLLHGPLETNPRLPGLPISPTEPALEVDVKECGTVDPGVGREASAL